VVEEEEEEAPLLEPPPPPTTTAIKNTKAAQAIGGMSMTTAAFKAALMAGGEPAPAAAAAVPGKGIAAAAKPRTPAAPAAARAGPPAVVASAPTPPPKPAADSATDTTLPPSPGDLEAPAEVEDGAKAMKVEVEEVGVLPTDGDPIPPPPSPPPPTPGAALLDRMLMGLGLKSAEGEEEAAAAGEEDTAATTTPPESPGFGDLFRRALSGLGLTPLQAPSPPPSAAAEEEEEKSASGPDLPDLGLRVRTGRPSAGATPPPPSRAAGEEEEEDENDDGDSPPAGGARGGRVVGAAAVAAAIAEAGASAPPKPRRSRRRAPPPPQPPAPPVTPLALPPCGARPAGPIAFVANDWPTAPLALRLKYVLRPVADAGAGCDHPPSCAACGGRGGSSGLCTSGACGGSSAQADAFAAALARSLRGARTAFCIHNLAYQGVFPAEAWGRLCLPPEAREAVEWVAGEDDGDGGEGSTSLPPPSSSSTTRQLNWMRGALVAADAIITVSPSYAAEITAGPAGACGLLGPLRAKGVRGIMNGLDTAEWDPASDALLPLASRYDVEGAAVGKAAAKAAFQAAHGLAVDPKPALVAYIGRLTDQKGVDVLLAAAPALVGASLSADGAHPPIQLAALGTGSPWMEAALAGLAPSFPGAAVGLPFFEEAAAHLVAAAADIIIVPSRFEPCGLVAQAATRYGAIPVVASVGGLKDLVTPDVGFQVAAPGGAGDPSAQRAAVRALIAGVRAAVAERGGDGATGAWRARQRAAMGVDVSWGTPAVEWEAALHELLRDG